MRLAHNPQGGNKQMKSKTLLITVVSVLVVGMMCGAACAKSLKVIIMQDSKGVAEKYTPLLGYLKKNGFSANFVSAQNYAAAAKMFANGEGDAMFGSSGVAGTLLIKDLAVPLARGVSKEGVSTYHAVVLARKGGAKFLGTSDFFKGKRVIFTSLASAGEFYYQSLADIKNIKATVEIASSHGGSLDALSRNAADVAIVKNLIWEKSSGTYPDIEKVGEDYGENPEMVLMVSKKVDAETAAELSRLLFALKNDASPTAEKVKSKLDIQGYIPTTRTDFKHTLMLLKQAGVTKSFDYSFKYQ